MMKNKKNKSKQPNTKELTINDMRKKFMDLRKEEKIYSLADIMKNKRKIFDIFATLNALEIMLKKELSGYEISKAEDLFKKEYPDMSDD